MPEEFIPIGEEGFDSETGRNVWWDGHGWSYRPPLIPQPRSRRIPLSFSQSRLWFVDQLNRGSNEYHLPEAIRLKGTLDVKSLERAFNALVERHESLRTRFPAVDGEPWQEVIPHLTLNLPVEDLSFLDEKERQRSVAAAMRREWDEPFDLTTGPLMRARLLKLAADDYILLRTCHHIISDGWSIAILNRELGEFYQAFRDSRAALLPPLPVQYPDFAVWQRNCMQGAALADGLAYWKKQLAGIPELLNLPHDRPRPALQTYEGRACVFSLSGARLSKLRAWSQERGATPYMTLLAVFATLLERYSGQDDIVIGSPSGNRTNTQLETLMGLFVNTIAMRLRVSPRKTFEQLIKDVRANTLDAWQHQDIPFE